MNLVINSSSARSRPIFVIAVPRGGSTLTYQCFIHRFRLHYLSNLWHFCYKLPFLGGLLSGYLSSSINPSSKFQSNYGFVPGLLGPAEGLHFWQRWFSCTISEMQVQGCLNHDEQYFSLVLHKLQAIFPPFISCFLGHSLCIDRLSRAFPDAIFVRVRRDPLKNSLSLLKGLRASGAKWFSVFPDECRPFLDSPDYYKVAAQCYFLNKRIDQSLASRNHFVLHYEDLCHDPDCVMTEFADYARHFGLHLDLLHQLPKSFAESTLSPADDMDLRILQNSLDELSARYGSLK